MTNIIELTYKELANTGELRLTEKDYSTNYLGRCKSYYAYLKSTGRQASTDVLLKLWAQLRLAEKQAKTRNKTKYDFFKKHQASHLQKTVSENWVRYLPVAQFVAHQQIRPTNNCIN